MWRSRQYQLQYFSSLASSRGLFQSTILGVLAWLSRTQPLNFPKRTRRRRNCKNLSALSRCLSGITGIKYCSSVTRREWKIAWTVCGPSRLLLFFFLFSSAFIGLLRRRYEFLMPVALEINSRAIPRYKIEIAIAKRRCVRTGVAFFLFSSSSLKLFY